MNAEKYKEILDERLFFTMDFLYSDSSDRWKFQQDNASCHTSVKAREYFDKIALVVIEWPANSPDLNPIENISSFWDYTVLSSIFGENELLTDY